MTTALYDTDFYQWTMRQVYLLRSEEFTQVDWDNLIEEIEGMASKDKRSLRSRARVLLTHLLKLSQMPIGDPVRGWRITVRDQRHEIANELIDSPSLKPYLIEQLPDAYTLARGDAADAMSIDASSFPIHCPWTPEQILDLDWLP